MIETKIIEWHRSKGLFEKTTTQEKRIAKLASELGELSDAILENKTPEAIMELGDMLVVMIAIAYKLGTNMHDCACMAYDKINSRTGKLINGTFVKD